MTNKLLDRTMEDFFKLSIAERLERFKPCGKITVYSGKRPASPDEEPEGDKIIEKYLFNNEFHDIH